MSEVEVLITDKRAIYINSTRITHRDTKWGIHHTVERFKCARDRVVEECRARGYDEWVRNIDDPEFVGQA